MDDYTQRIEKGLKMECTSICHCKTSNYQIDHAGQQHDCIANFESWCVGNDVIWAYLFDQKNGQQVANYNNVHGLTTSAALEAENTEQARLLGMSAEREADLRGEVERLTTALKKAQEVLDDCRGNINPERGDAEELERDVVEAIATITEALK